MKKRYCVNCGELLGEKQTYCFTCGTVNELPVKKATEKTEPFTFIPEIDETINPANVDPEDHIQDSGMIAFPEDDDVAEDVPADIPAIMEYTAPAPVVEEKEEEQEEEPEEEVPAEVPSEMEQEPLFEEIEETVADEDTDQGTEELPLLEEEEPISETHMNPMLADTNSSIKPVTSEIEIPVFNKKSAHGTDILEATPIDTETETRVYANPFVHTKPVEIEQNEEPDQDDEDETDYYEEEEDTGNTPVLVGVLVVLLALLLGAFAYIWFVRPELIGRKPASETPVVSSVSADTGSSSALPSDISEDPSDTETDANTVNLTDPVASTDPALISGDPVAVGDVTGEVIGYARVNMETLLIYTDHSTASKALGHARYDANYEVDEIFEDGEYTWYRIAEDMWIPDSNGQWVTYEAE